MIAHSPHPLFPVELEEQPEEGEDVEEIGHIRVTRFNPSQNRYVWALESFRPDELMSLEQLHEHFGGGKFELYAHVDQAGHPGAIIRRIRYDIPGPLQPLVQGEVVDVAASPAPSSTARSSGESAGDAGMSSMTQMFMMMMKAQSDQQALLLAMMQNQGQIMVAALQSRGGGSDAASAALGQIAAAAIQHRPAETTTESVLRAVQLGRELGDGGGGDPGADDESVAESILEGVQAFRAIADTQGPAAIPGRSRPPGMNPNAPPQAPAKKPAA